MTVALTRGIAILEALGQQDGMTLSEVSRALAIPKSSARRLLLTLQAHHLVRQSLMDQKFRCNITLPHQSQGPQSSQAWLLCDVALKHARRLTEQVRWPSDIFLPFEDGLRLVESTRSLTPLHIYQSKINTRVDWLHSAASRVYLAFSGTNKRAQILEQYFAKSKKSAAEKRELIAAIEQDLAKIKQQGYAFRTADYFGESIPYDRLRGVAVPIMMDEQVVACINLIWLKDFASEVDFCAQYLPQLLACAGEIVQEIMNFNKI